MPSLREHALPQIFDVGEVSVMRQAHSKGEVRVHRLRFFLRVSIPCWEKKTEITKKMKNKVEYDKTRVRTLSAELNCYSVTDPMNGHVMYTDHVCT